MRIVYSFFLYLLAPLIVLRLFWLGYRNPDYRSRWKERFGFPDKITSDDKIIWLHAVSVGEVQAARPLVNGLLEEYPDFRILITTMTPTGADTVRQYFAESVGHFYLPYDLPVSVKRFLSIIDPTILIVMETELWPNLFHYCQANNVPVVVVNARMSDAQRTRADALQWTQHSSACPRASIRARTSLRASSARSLRRSSRICPTDNRSTFAHRLQNRIPSISILLRKMNVL